MTGFTPELVERCERVSATMRLLARTMLDEYGLGVCDGEINALNEASRETDEIASGIAELTEALRELRAEVQRLLLTTQADTKRADCPVMAVAKASAKAGNVLAQHGRSK